MRARGRRSSKKHSPTPERPHAPATTQFSAAGATDPPARRKVALTQLKLTVRSAPTATSPTPSRYETSTAAS